MRFKTSKVRISITFFVSMQLLICSSFRFTWIEKDSLFDCIVGIVLDGKPVGMGIIYSNLSIITSLNPLNTKLRTELEGDKVGPYSPVQMYVIDGAWDKARPVGADHVTGKQFREHWMSEGSDSRNTTAYDFLYISTVRKYSNFTYYKTPMPNLRFPYIVQVAPNNYTYYIPSGWKVVALSYTDHESLKLVNTYFSKDPVEDCDKWLPRPNGHFIICLNNKNFRGIQSGAALFNGNRLYGLGAFQLNKGDKTILVFTDLRYYSLKDI